MAKFIKVNDNNYSSVKGQYSRLILYFTTAWCQPCKTFKPMLKSIVTRISDPRFAVAEIDAEKVEKLAIKYKIYSVPTIIFLKNSKKGMKIEGIRSRSILQNKIEKFLQ